MVSDTAGIERELVALSQGLAFRRERLGLIELVGPDAPAFCHRVLSADIAALSVDQAAPAALLTAKSHVRFALDALRVEGGVQLVSDLATHEALRSAIDRLLVMDRVEVGSRMLETLRIIEAGPADASRTLALPAPGERGVLTLGDRLLPALGEDGLARPGAFLLDQDQAQIQSASEALTQLGAVEVSAAAVEVCRIEAGVPSAPFELREDVLLLEAGQLARVALNKGCYIGQEPVCRIHNRGQVNRLLCGVRLDGAISAHPGTALQHEAKEEAGWITSLAVSPRSGAIGLALVHRKVIEAGGVARVEGGGSAEIVTLPFVPHQLVPRCFPRYGR